MSTAEEQVSGAAEALDTGTDHILAELESGILTLTLNRPERRNALSTEMSGGLARMLVRAEDDAGVRAIILTGAGGAFCAGGDVKGMAERSANADQGALVRAQQENQRATSGAIYRHSKPVIAAIPGPVAGAGLALALACDLRVMSDEAVFTTAFAGVGLTGDYGATWFLPNLVGTAKARELFLLPERASAEDALRLGLVNWLAPKASVMDKAREVAGRLAAGPTVAYGLIKANLNRAFDEELEPAMDIEAENIASARKTADHKEAASAFVEKRKPTFKGE